MFVGNFFQCRQLTVNCHSGLSHDNVNYDGTATANYLTCMVTGGGVRAGSGSYKAVVLRHIYNRDRYP